MANVASWQHNEAEVFVMWPNRGLRPFSGFGKPGKQNRIFGPGRGVFGLLQKAQFGT
jgi:hypothetical protein